MPFETMDAFVVENDDNMTHSDEESLDMDALLESLNAEQKACIELFYFQEKSYKEIADLNAMNIRQVKSHIQNGKRNLKILLTQKTGGGHGSR